MAFNTEKEFPQFADLKGMLAQSKTPDNALTQTLTILIDRLEQVESVRAEVFTSINNSVNNITSVVNYLMNNGATYLTELPEELALPNSWQLLPGTNVTFDKSVPHKLKINAAGGGGPGGGMDLDYLGDYVQGPVYNDGDIVIGADGVLYMCTVDGTVTPPEPWPGAGIAVNQTVDAKYWLVSPHAYLPNGRSLNAFINGYVRSTAGEPSVVATIPLTDTTGILPDNRLTSNVALKNINNNFSVAQTFVSGNEMVGVTPRLYWKDTTGGVDAKVWDIVIGSGTLYIEAFNDALNVSMALYHFTRAGTLIAGGFQGVGSGLTSLNASQLTTGTVPIGRLGTNAPAANLFLRGDNTWQVPPAADAFPSGMTVLSRGIPCPVGWTRVTDLDGYFIRIGPGGAGGANTHAHGPGTLFAANHDHGGTVGVSVNVSVSGTVDADGNHSHSWGGSFGGRTSDSIGGSSGADQGGSFTAPYNAHSHDYNGTVGGQTGDAGVHAHNFRADGSGSGSGGIPFSGNLGIGGATDAQSNVPLYADWWLCQKN